MNPFDVVRNAIPLLGLLAGALLGWGVSASHNRRGSAARPSRRETLGLHADEKQDGIHGAEVTLAQLDVRLNYLNKAIASARQQVEESEQEHDRLLVTLDERQASVKDAQNNLQTIRKNLTTRTQEADQLLTDIDKSIEELDMLQQMQDSYMVKINHLTQQVQWQDSELRMLRQSMKAKTGEMNEARALLDQRDAELRLLIRQRQQREIDIEHARQVLAQRTDELRQKVSAGGADPFGEERPAPRLPAQRIDVTPPEVRQLPGASTAPANPAPVLDLEMEDDLTVIPRLAEFYARQLNDHGIRTIRKLAALSEDEVRAMLDIPPHHSPNIDGWLKAARRLTRQRRNNG